MVGSYLSPNVPCTNCVVNEVLPTARKPNTATLRFTRRGSFVRAKDFICLGRDGGEGVVGY